MHSKISLREPSLTHALPQTPGKVGIPQPHTPYGRQPSPPAGHSGSSVISTVVVRSVSELEPFEEQWRTLAANAIDPNVFYDPCMLLPALRHAHERKDILIVLQFTANPDCPTGPAILCGMFPFEHRMRFRGYPLRVLRLLRYKYNRLCTPLVHKAFVCECIHELLEWLEQCTEPFLFAEFGFLTGDGRVAQELHQEVAERKFVALQSEYTTRALFKPGLSAEAYLEQALKGKRRKELRRLESRLTETGHVEYRRLQVQDDATPWTEAFLELESRGWKGLHNTALASLASDAQFFKDCALQAHRHGQLMMLGLFVDDKPIAMKCNFLSGHGAFAFKIAFDEGQGRYSPGVLLEIENIRVLYTMAEIEWMDSTAVAKHPMINRLWTERRTIETLLVSPHRRLGNFLISIIPLLRWVKISAGGVFKALQNLTNSSDKRAEA